MFQLLVAELHRCVRDCERIEVPDSSHEMPADNPETYNQVVLEFLAKQAA